MTTTATPGSGWKPFHLEYSKQLNEGIQQQHFAVQLIAYAGHHLISQRQDDSNTSMMYRTDTESFVGEEMDWGLRLALKLTDLKLQILSRNMDVQAEIPLEGDTLPGAFGKMKQALSELDVDVSELKRELHYDLPDHPIAGGAAFELVPGELQEETIRMRCNADIILNQVASGFPNAEAARIWPHHFDSGSFVTLKINEAGGVSRSIGLGWATPDKMLEEPYYYLSYWSEEPVENFSTLPDPGTGKWISTGWTGCYLKHCEILKEGTASGQEELVKRFFNSGIQILFDHINL